MTSGALRQSQRIQAWQLSFFTLVDGISTTWVCSQDYSSGTWLPRATCRGCRLPAPLVHRPFGYGGGCQASSRLDESHRSPVQCGSRTYCCGRRFRWRAFGSDGCLCAGTPPRRRRASCREPIRPCAASLLSTQWWTWDPMWPITTMPRRASGLSRCRVPEKWSLVSWVAHWRKCPEETTCFRPATTSMPTARQRCSCRETMTTSFPWGRYVRWHNGDPACRARPEDLFLRWYSRCNLCHFLDSE